MRIEHDLPLLMILMDEPLANYVKSLDCRCEPVKRVRKLGINYYHIVGAPDLPTDRARNEFSVTFLLTQAISRREA
jgi:hypothetical protein